MIQRNDFCWCGSAKKWKKCHYPQEAPMDHAKFLAKEYLKRFKISLKSKEEIEGIRRAGHLAAKILDRLCKEAKEGVSTAELDELSMQLHKEAGAKPAPLGYGKPPFPKSICTSLNDVICHGIPNHKALEKGDIVNIDVTSILDTYYGDCSRMVVIGGSCSEEKQLVVDVSYQCLMRSIEILKPGLPLNEIGNVISDYAESMGCSVVHQFVGHGVGSRFHEAPQIHHNRNDDILPLAAGMTFTIEPMINAGSPEAIIDQSDQWTARTEDGKASAQWEHTLVITKNGCEILTPIPS